MDDHQRVMLCGAVGGKGGRKGCQGENVIHPTSVLIQPTYKGENFFPTQAFGHSEHANKIDKENRKNIYILPRKGRKLRKHQAGKEEAVTAPRPTRREKDDKASPSTKSKPQYGRGLSEPSNKLINQVQIKNRIARAVLSRIERNKSSEVGEADEKGDGGGESRGW